MLRDDLTLRSIGVVLVIVAFLKARLAVARSREAVVTLQLQQELDGLARRDALTGLANRRAFLEVAHEWTSRGEPVAVAVADLDRFKAANDSFGHHTGDAILKEVSARMTGLAPSAICIARLGGDEFALLFDGRMAEARIAAELAAVRKSVAMPNIAGNTPVTVSLSMGLACPPEDLGDIGQLLQIADRRLYADKASVRSRRAIREFAPILVGDLSVREDRRRWRSR
jgi:diguanylate cyclase (GGDEF)-like protein